MWLERFFAQKNLSADCLGALGAERNQSNLSKGRQARLDYLMFVKRHFEVIGDRSLVLTPEVEVLRRLYATIESGKTKRSMAPPRDWEIRARALHDTLGYFGLPLSTSESQFEKITTTQSAYYPARHYFQRRENQLREMMESTGPTTIRSPEQFKASIVELIYQLRIENLDAAVREAEELHNQEITLRETKSGKSAQIKILDLLNTKIQFIEAENLTLPDSTIENLPPKRSPSLGTKYVIKYIDPRPDYFYKSHSMTTQIADRTVQLSTSNGQIFFVSERQFANLLESLAPENLADYFGPDPIRHRFRLEAVARDIQLANITKFLQAKEDQSLESLYMRLKKRVDERKFSQSEATPSLSFEINNAGPRVLEASAASDLIWYGWGQHPQFWKHRFRESAYMGLPYAGEQANRKAKKQIRKETKRASWRNRSDSQRQAILRNRGLKWAGLLFGGWLLYQYPPDINLDHMAISIASIQTARGRFEFSEGLGRIVAPKIGNGRRQ